MRSVTGFVLLVAGLTLAMLAGFVDLACAASAPEIVAEPGPGFLATWWPWLLTSGIGLFGAMLVNLIHKYAAVLHAKIDAEKWFKSVAIETQVDKWAHEIVSIVEKKAAEYVENHGGKKSMPSEVKLANAVSMLQDWTKSAGVPVEDAEAAEYVETAHSAMEKAADFQ